MFNTIHRCILKIILYISNKYDIDIYIYIYIIFIIYKNIPKIILELLYILTTLLVLFEIIPNNNLNHICHNQDYLINK